ncbi:hypothetical protein [Caulobacter hibisci]|uniref:Phytoene synthase n=1 Tax=Caulobacter hibisci TaxID=2035993 RepID=A0ABS0T252_9CAUL|nr:hypothetical protein [Caulobacter hibisci]MBI1685899.1 hypothetical protein [Caulobacter hibisci]
MHAPISPAPLPPDNEDPGPCPSPGQGLTTAAASALIAAAGVVEDAWTHTAPREAATRLSLHAEELASSPLARDQLLSRALELAAQDLEAGRRPLAHWPLFFARDLAPPAEAREDVRDWVLAHAEKEGADPMLADGEAVAQAVEARAVRELGDAFETARGLTRRLRVEAWLQMVLWDDPRIPANAETRWLMRAGGRRLMARLGEA